MRWLQTSVIFSVTLLCLVSRPDVLQSGMGGASFGRSPFYRFRWSGLNQSTRSQELYRIQRGRTGDLVAVGAPRPLLRPAWQAHAPPRPWHSVAECQFSTNLIITFDRNKIQTSNWYHFISLVKAIRMTYNKALTDQVMTLIRGIFKFTTLLYDLK